MNKIFLETLYLSTATLESSRVSWRIDLSCSLVPAFGRNLFGLRVTGAGVSSSAMPGTSPITSTLSFVGTLFKNKPIIQSKFRANKHGSSTFCYERANRLVNIGHCTVLDTHLNAAESLSWCGLSRVASKTICKSKVCPAKNSC